MTTLSIERSQYGAYWLMLHQQPGDEGRKIAVFASEQAAEMYKAAWRSSMEFARETGRSGI